MNQHFCPRPSQRNNKTGAIDEKIASPKYVGEPPYKIVYWRKTKLGESTSLFYICFTVDNNPETVCLALREEFGELINKIPQWAYWYEIQLNQQLTWAEIIERVDKAFKGKVP